MRAQVCTVILSMFLVSTFSLEYTQFHYRKSKSHESIFRNKVNRCYSECLHLDSHHEKLACEYQCASRDCYNSVYAKDPLEEGEVDIRLPHFKGCVIEEHKRKY